MAWLSGWEPEQRFKLEIDNTLIDGELTNFPVMVKLSDASGIGDVDLSAVFDELEDESLKIAVTLSDETTECKVEIEYWDDASETAILHVKVPTVASGADTVLYLYYDSGHADNTTNVGDVGSTPGKAVWDSDFIGVYHYASFEDSTGNSLDMIGSSVDENNLLSTDLGLGVDLGGDPDYMYVSDDPLLDSATGKTVEFIMRLDSNFDISDSVDLGIFSRYDASSYVSGEWLIRLESSTGKLLCGWVNGSDAWQDLSSDKASWIVSTRYGVALTDASDGSKIFIDGVIDNSDVVDRSFQTNTKALLVGVKAGLADFFSGNIDEVRISNVKRSDEWIKATYHTLFDSLITFEDEYPPGIPIAMHHYTKNIGT